MLNTHHMLYQKQHWNKGWLKRLRDYWYFKVEVDSRFHKQIHTQVNNIPPLSNYAAKMVYITIVEMNDDGMLCKFDSHRRRLEVLINLIPGDQKATLTALKKIQSIY